VSGRRAPTAARALVGTLGVWGLLLTAGIAVTAAAATGAAPSIRTAVISSLGPGYTVVSEGPLNPSELASRWPDPAAAAGALATLARTTSTYERVWEDDGGANQVQDLLVAFPSVLGAQAFQQVAQHALQSGEIVSAGALAPIPGARRTVYFASTPRAGVGQAITMRAGTDVDLLSFLSTASARARPISPAAALRVAQAQHAAMVVGPGGTVAPAGGTAPKGPSFAALGWAALAVAVLGVAVATPVVLRRHRARTPDQGPGPRVRSESPS
jgi:hypothetical protein